MTASAAKKKFLSEKIRKNKKSSCLVKAHLNNGRDYDPYRNETREQKKYKD